MSKRHDETAGEDGALDAVEEARRLLAEGKTLREVCAALESGGYKTPRGKNKWWPASVKNILKPTTTTETPQLEASMDERDDGNENDSRGKNGGLARAQKLTPEQRSEIASRRWADRRSHLIRATHMGPLVIGDIVIPSAVLADGRRLLMQEGIAAALGRTAKPERSLVESSSEIPHFLDAKGLKPYIPKEFAAPVSPVEFLTTTGQRAFGYRAEILPDVCGVYVDAHDADALSVRQMHIYERAKLLLRSFARVGIIALVDEATGYQAERARDELQRILAAYISPELLPWTKRFPDEFFKQVYKIHDWKYLSGDMRGPRYVGKFINKYVYERLPPGVLEELRSRNPVVDGRRKHRHHQFLTEDTGHPHLDRHVSQMVVVMRLSENKGQFQRLFERAFPKPGEQMQLIPDRVAVERLALPAVDESDEP